MDELVDNIKTKSLTAALEPLTEQVDCYFYKNYKSFRLGLITNFDRF